MTDKDLRRKKILCSFMIWAIAIFIPIYWFHEPARQEAAGARMKKESIDRGAQIFVANCVVCHQMTGTGIPGKNLRRIGLDETVLVKTISRGRPGTGKPGTAMPPFSDQEGGPLKQFQILDVINFIRDWDQSVLESAAAARRAQLLGK